MLPPHLGSQGDVRFAAPPRAVIASHIYHWAGQLLGIFAVLRPATGKGAGGVRKRSDPMRSGRRPTAARNQQELGTALPNLPRVASVVRGKSFPG